MLFFSTGLIAERALLERRLEEAHIHLSEIKTTWSNKIAILETQVKCYNLIKCIIL